MLSLSFGFKNYGKCYIRFLIKFVQSEEKPQYFLKLNLKGKPSQLKYHTANTAASFYCVFLSCESTHRLYSRVEKWGGV